MSAENKNVVAAQQDIRIKFRMNKKKKVFGVVGSTVLFGITVLTYFDVKPGHIASLLEQMLLFFTGESFELKFGLLLIMFCLFCATNYFTFWLTKRYWSIKIRDMQFPKNIVASVRRLDKENRIDVDDLDKVRSVIQEWELLLDLADTVPVVAIEPAPHPRVSFANTRRSAIGIRFRTKSDSDFMIKYDALIKHTENVLSSVARFEPDIRKYYIGKINPLSKMHNIVFKNQASVIEYVKKTLCGFITGLNSVLTRLNLVYEYSNKEKGESSVQTKSGSLKKS